jgi:tryptophanyl-tRNA synthetase
MPFYLQAGSDADDTAAGQDHHVVAALGDIPVKRRLEELLQTLVAPIRERREVLAQDPDRVLDILNTGTRAARERTQARLHEVRTGLGMFMLKR